ncbi:amidohydrolase family protein [Kineobactrum salinum]|uniref:Amidohydrolase family protein n=1 Tax=Kineobactrum salinum TaxID=2708301 RepID=A0A6C0U9W6_9GAMM|nr:amidohydrolase family protein [Kineobactrum salinum]QIB66514.1 amidohydrolase family protein [Kineobactrum salinum]
MLSMIRSYLSVLALVLGYLFCPSAIAVSDSEARATGTTSIPETYVIHAGHLLAVPGQPAEARKSIVVQDGKIVAIKEGFVDGPRVVDLSQAYVLPGLIDLHTHMSLPSLEQMNTWRLRRPEAVMLETLPRLQSMLEAGFTTVRDLGDEASIMYQLADATRRGIVTGPRIIASEPFFGIGNGYSSADTLGFRAELEPFYASRGYCESRDQCRNAVREEIRRGAGVIKIRLSYMPLVDGRIESVETVEEIKWIIDMAHQLKRTVAVHTVVGASGAPVSNAILAGADTIEHGPLGEEEIALMKEMGTAYVPTLSVARLSTQYPQLYPKIRAGAKKAAYAGVKFGFGSDFPLVSIPRSFEEFLELQAVGLTPTEAIKAATVNAADILQMSDEIGSIGPGKAADIIAVMGDPETDLRLLGNIAFVMKAGVIVKGLQ